MSNDLYPVGTSVIVHGNVIGVRGDEGAEDYRIETYDGARFWVSWVVVDASAETREQDALREIKAILDTPGLRLSRETLLRLVEGAIK